ncbi:hypothetical protein [Clostridium fallax]|uniref:Uncharacterized protein n=1 Tax=Clostridium fallax TaxID=1533 RepID=A0A1M4U8Q7_9CLOT|nr:hypothetical protein [Clostridium fallax]SHE52987.1 hypothetical protein SAMN05443638_10489 [Clostridium fallax]SQB06131.1 Uncharacterised protein [Clostridium fallax]
MEYISFDELRWINKFLQPNLTLTKEDMEELKTFTFMWEMFEAKACEGVSNAQNIADFVLHKLDLPPKNRESSVIDAYYVYFKNRYIVDGKENELFEKMTTNLNEGFSNGERKFDVKTFILDTLLEKNPTEKNKLLTILLIIYRIRGNFYERSSNLIKVKDQYKIYAVANNIIAMVLDRFAKKI